MKIWPRTLLFLAICLLFPMAAVKGDWKSDANARIELNRKRNAQITVVDSNSQPVPGLNVQIEQVKHRFGFGAALAYGLLSSNSSYRSFVLDHFEWAVCENEMKWQSTENIRDNEQYGQADYIADWCADNDIPLRGHCILWEQSNSQMPPWLRTTPPLVCSEMVPEINERVDSIVGRYAGQIVQWDVDNEMLPTGSDYNFFGTCLGDQGRANVFNRAKQIDPGCGMYMNEFTGNSFGGYDGNEYVARASSLINTYGAQIDGLGIQAHVSSPFRPEDYYNSVLNELDNLGLPIIATEFDTDAGTATQVADDLENFYRICFSHPSVEGIMMWGIEQSAWRWDGIVNSSTWVHNEAGVRYDALMAEWTTNDANYTNPSGNVNFRGFHGTYQITLSAPGQTPEVHQIELEPGTGTEQFSLLTDLEEPVPDNTPPTPNPMTWFSAPAATGPSSITMTATTASDDTPPVQYYFECTNHGDANSSWQTSPTYIAQGLSPSTQYTFRVRARDSAVVPNVTGWSGTASATTQPPGTDVNILGSWATGTSHTKESGYSRALVFIAQEESISGTPILTSVTYGGQAMTKVIEISAVSGYGNYVAAFILNEAGVAAATSGTFSPTWSATTSSVSYASVFLGNVDQTALTAATASNMTTSGTDPISTAALATDGGDMVILGAVCGNSGSYILSGGFTEGTDQTAGGSYGHTGVTGHKLATGASETPSADHSSTVIRQAIIGFVVNAQNVPTYSNCAEVIAAGHRLPSDLSGDCYVNYMDVNTMAYYWLNGECNASNNYCGLSDFEPRDGAVDFFDFSDFAMQWLVCNDPQDPGCTPNW